MWTQACVSFLCMTYHPLPHTLTWKLYGQDVLFQWQTKISCPPTSPKRRTTTGAGSIGSDQRGWPITNPQSLLWDSAGSDWQPQHSECVGGMEHPSIFFSEQHRHRFLHTGHSPGIANGKPNWWKFQYTVLPVCILHRSVDVCVFVEKKHTKQKANWFLFLSSGTSVHI